jgi:glycosyltransferase involved in cell wall biosynthesis
VKSLNTSRWSAFAKASKTPPATYESTKRTGSSSQSPEAVRPPDPVKVVHVIARLNIGGPAIQAITLTRTMTGSGYATTLVRGVEDDHEGSMDDLARELGVEPVLIPSLRRNPGWYDLKALLALIRLMHREQPDIVHTHAAKAGTLGRIAAIVAGWGRRTKPIVVHTYHGHSLTGYFSPRVAGIYRRIEQLLAHRTDKLVAVSDEVRDELIALRVAPPDRFEVIPLGFDLSRFVPDPRARAAIRKATRAELNIAQDAIVVILVARLVPIKRVDRFLHAARALSRNTDGVRFLIVGDGELGDELRASAAARALGDTVIWTGFRHDIDALLFASEIAVLCSDNEGTPVSLIEASAAGLPVVSTRVGGAATVVKDGQTGFLVERGDGDELARAVRRLVEDPDLRATMGRAGQAHARNAFTLERLNDDLAALYRELTLSSPPT